MSVRPFAGKVPFDRLQEVSRPADRSLPLRLVSSFVGSPPQFWWEILDGFVPANLSLLSWPMIRDIIGEWRENGMENGKMLQYLWVKNTPFRHTS